MLQYSHSTPLSLGPMRETVRIVMDKCVLLQDAFFFMVDGKVVDKSSAESPLT